MALETGGSNLIYVSNYMGKFEVRVKRVIEQVGACAQQGLTIARTQGRQRVAIQDALALE